MTRATYIERLLRQVYGGQPTDDANITNNLVNVWLSEGIAIAARTNYLDNNKLDGIAYVNNGFYCTFKGLSISKDEIFLYKITLPHIPMGIGASEGISTLNIKSSDGSVSFPCIPLSENQKGFARSLRPVPNKLLFYQEGIFCYILSVLILNSPSVPYTGSVSMISGGVSTDLDSELTVPPDYLPIIDEYITKQLLIERAQPQDTSNDGLDQK